MSEQHFTRGERQLDYLPQALGQRLRERCARRFVTDFGHGAFV
ncbi:hypothetical protein [Trinickia violacea]|nr:hypothetical protein [Trinickia violacea]